MSDPQTLPSRATRDTERHEAGRRAEEMTERGAKQTGEGCLP